MSVEQELREKTAIAEQKIKIMTVKEQLEKRFVYSGKNIEALETAHQLNKNIVTYGKGGYGKSDICAEFLRLKGHTPYILALGVGSKTEDLFGPINVQEFTQNSKFVYNVQDSFMNHEYVILEEAFDAPAELLAQLKDVLSSGWFRKGSQQFKIKTKMIIICTNKERKEYAKNNSIKALMERFPLEKKFDWEKHNAITYGNLITTVKGPQYANPLLLQILEDFAASGADNTVSPRIALEAAELLHECGVECLNLIADFKAQPKILENAIKNFSFNLKFNQLVEEVDTVYKRFKKVENDSDQKEEMATVKGLLELKKNELEAIPATEEKVQDKANAVKRVNEYIKNITKTLQITTTFDIAEEESDNPF